MASGSEAAFAQTDPPSSWGVSAGFVPKWESTGSIKKLGTLVFSDENGEIDLRGSEFRIGVARGRRLGGGWEVSFVQKNFDADATQTLSSGSGCTGSGSQTTFVFNCTNDFSELTPDSLKLIGIEANKFISFVTIAERIQIGMNVGGGIASGKGSFQSVSFHETFQCRFANGQQPNFGSDDDDPCFGGALVPGTKTQTGVGTEPFTTFLTYDRNLVPLGRVEIAAAVLVAPRVKVRLSGGFNFPGSNVIAITGLYFFGDN